MSGNMHMHGQRKAAQQGWLVMLWREEGEVWKRLEETFGFVRCQGKLGVEVNAVMESEVARPIGKVCCVLVTELWRSISR